ncbi:MAG TPA: threonine ammonia-lyase [Verrucomicrobiae bacterium]|nr:threonine ammonia-lyase [Verrucomicrobiae bacterium]
MPPSVTFEDVESAGRRIAGTIVETPCPASIPLSEATGSRIYCKLEYLQRTGSFKERGARNALLLLSNEQKKRGVIAASAGNHALGVAYHAQLLNIPATVVMPRFAPLTKIVNSRRFGATVVVDGANISEARQRADQIAAELGLYYINGFDDPAIIAGQGTLGLEIAAQVPDMDAVIVPIGGGGLIAGTALALKRLKPAVRVIGVEPERAASFTAALKSGKPVKIDMKPTLADGLAVPKVGENAFEIARSLIERVVLVSERDLARAVLRLMELEKAVVEGAGAAPLAACLSGSIPDLNGRSVVLLLCGGNIDLNALDRVIERGLASDGRLCQFTATISDRPGGLARFAGLVAEEGASIVDITHDRVFAEDDISTVAVHCVVETRDAEHITTLRARLQKEGFPLS